MDEELVKKKIGKKEVDDAYARLQKYKEEKQHQKQELQVQRNGGRITTGSALTVNFATQMIPSQ